MDTNAPYVSERITAAGAEVIWRTTVGDDIEAITEAIGRGIQRADIVISTGGLGPTHDDITKKAVCRYFKRPLVFYDNILKKIEKRFQDRGIKMPAINQNQALLPQRAEFIDNPIGSAVGIVIDEDGRLFVAVPGVPSEMRAMVDGWICETIRERSAGSTTLHRKIRTVGIIESVLYEKLADLIDSKQRSGERVDIAFLPSWGGVDVRLSVKTKDQEAGQKAIRDFDEKISERVGKYIYGYDNVTLPEVVGRILREKNLTIAVAESCTGGLLGKMITDVPGSSDYFLGGIIAYSNELKMKFLTVPQIILEKYGAVSAECARYMAEGAVQNLGANIGISVTGIAGPDGGTEEKPVGLVYVGFSVSGKSTSREFRFGNDRERNRERSAVVALEMARRYLLNMG